MEHPGELEIFNKVKTLYWWPRICQWIKNYVKGYNKCQQFKIDKTGPPLLYPINGPTSLQPFAQCSMDFITSLPTSKGFDSILSIVNYGLTKGIILVLCKKTIIANKLVSILLIHLYQQFGLPDKMISDRGLQFVAHLFQALLNKLGIKSSLSIAFHLQSDGTTEWYNQEIKTYLSIYCIAHPYSWVDHLPFLEFAHNSW